MTAYKPTVVTNALTGSFSGPSDLNLVQSKGNNLVVNLATPEGLKPLVDVTINGRITIMQLFRPQVRTLLRYRCGNEGCSMVFLFEAHPASCFVIYTMQFIDSITRPPTYMYTVAPPSHVMVHRSYVMGFEKTDHVGGCDRLCLTPWLIVLPAVYNTLSMGIAYACTFTISSYHLTTGVAQPVLDLNG